MESEEKQKWMDAMQDEIKSLHDNHTYDLVKLPNGKKRKGVDFNEISSLVVKIGKEDCVCRLSKSLYGLKQAPR
ncbi:hypothetical protein CR513_53244, partial [Mucuna pruriens]